MSFPSRVSAICLLVAVASLQSVISDAFAQEEPTKSLAPLEGRLTAIIPPLLKQHRVPGIAVAVVEQGQSFVQGYGVRAAGRDDGIGPDTVFEAASLGKPLFSYLILENAHAGRFDLDASLAADLEEPFVENDTRIDRVTARHVLSHTSGLPNWRPDRFTSNPKPLAFDRDPGSAFGYSGEGFMYLQAVVEARSGLSCEDIMQRDLLGPMGMTGTSYIWSGEETEAYARPHNQRGQIRRKWRTREPSVAYSLHTTAPDYAAFLRRMIDPGDEIARALLEPQVEWPDNEALAWGLGWGLERRADGFWFWHWGDNGDFKHFVIGSQRERRAVLVLTNGRRGA